MSGINYMDAGYDATKSAVMPIPSDSIDVDIGTPQPNDEPVELNRLAAITELVTRITSTADPERAGRVLANELRSFLDCSQVVFGLCDAKGCCRVTCISDLEVVDSNTDSARTAQAALQEAVAHRKMSVWPARDDIDRQGLLAHQHFANMTGDAAVLSLPLMDEERDEVRGALLLTGAVEAMHGSSIRNFASAVSNPLACAFHLLQRARQNRLQKWLTACTQHLRSKKGRTTQLLIVVLIALLLTPFPYKVKCECELQPVLRRFVAMPFDGRLETAFVEPGEIVAQDQLLAKIDAREIQWELAAVQADLHRARKELAGYVVAHESGKAKIAQLEVERLTMRTALYTHRNAHLEIKSPIEGMVVSGDLEESEGVQLQVGQSLFEIAPLDQMVVEISVPEDDIRLIESGMDVKIWFNSFPLRRWDAKLENIHPRSELRDDDNVFIAEVRIVNAEDNLRPGMHGRTQIVTGWSPLGWNLFHKPTAAVLEWLGW